MSDTVLEKYIERYLNGLLTPDEALALQALLEDAGNSEKLDLLMRGQFAGWEKAGLDFPEVTARVRNGVAEQIAAGRAYAVPPARERFLIPVWLRYAAAALVIITAAAYLWNVRQATVPELTDIARNEKHDIAPGRTGALLTLSDGRQVSLDSMGNGTIATDGGSRIVLKNGQLAYTPPATPDSKIIYNTMSTPKGRQFQMVLPDGSRVWLNAASAIRYPAVFNGTERVVTLTGEAYFEVAPDASMPFRVVTDKGTRIDVLGTSFNINSYDNEALEATTLVDGAVMVTAGSVRHQLQPAEQVRITANGLPERHSNTDIAQVLAWKNGYFDFNNTDLPGMMRQLERWYDIDIKYEGTIPREIFKGKMDRNVPLSAVLQFLRKSGISTGMDNRTLIIHGR